MEEKKRSALSRLLDFAGNRKPLMAVGCVLVGVSMLMSMVPYACAWLVARDLVAVAPNWQEATGIASYGWMAFGFAFAGIAVYCGGLMCTHLVAFRIASNIRKICSERLMKAPLGYFDSHASGLLRRRINSAGADAEQLMAHNLSMVFQDVTLFDDTVMENIRLGRSGATNDEVLATARAANCDEFVRNLSQGYATPIGENGAMRSSGERQRISIARALLKDAPVLLLDEATASLDVESETRVQEALSRLIVGKTVLVIAHRMRTVEATDKVVVLEAGRVVEQGRPNELRATTGSLFAHMTELQQTSAAWRA